MFLNPISLYTRIYNVLLAISIFIWRIKVKDFSKLYIMDLKSKSLHKNYSFNITGNLSSDVKQLLLIIFRLQYITRIMKCNNV